MDIKLYQDAVARTMNKDLDYIESLSNYSMGLAGEAGEVLEPLKKFLYHGHELDTKKLADELADVAWYISALANTLGIDLSEALERNIVKLKQRYPEGFDTTDSINRRD